MKNYFYLAFTEACMMEGIVPNAWTASNGFSTSTATAMKNGSRPSVDTLQKISKNWSSKEIGLKILIGHLKDEIERAGCSLDDIVLGIKNDKKQTDTLDEDLKTVQQFMNRRPIRESIHGLAVLLKRSEWAREDEAKRIRAQAEQDAVMHRLSATKKRGKQQNERTA